MLIIHLLYIDDGGTFKNMIKQSANVLSLNKFDYKLGNTPFLEKVNVNDYGAKGNGSTDDTEIHIYSLIDTKIGMFPNTYCGKLRFILHSK